MIVPFTQKESFTTYCLVLPPISEIQHADEHSGHLINARNLPFMNVQVQMFFRKPLDIRNLESIFSLNNVIKGGCVVCY